MLQIRQLTLLLDAESSVLHASLIYIFLLPWLTISKFLEHISTLIVMNTDI